MVWFKVDDGFANSEPVMRVPRRYRASVIGLWTLSGTWCAKELTDGRVPAHMIEELAGTKAQADQLVSCGLWAQTPTGYEFIGWAKYQPTRSEIEEQRRKEAERKAKYRMSQRDADGTPPSVPKASQQESGHPDPTRPDPSSTKKRTPATRGSRVPFDFVITGEMREWAKGEVPLVNLDLKLREWIDYWSAVPGEKGIKLDWVSTWRNGMRKQQEFAEKDRSNVTPIVAKKKFVAHVD